MAYVPVRIQRSWTSKRLYIQYITYILHVCMHVCTYRQTRVEGGDGFTFASHSSPSMPSSLQAMDWEHGPGVGDPCFKYTYTCIRQGRYMLSFPVLSSTIPPLSVTQGQPSLVSRKWPKGGGCHEEGSLRPSQRLCYTFLLICPLGPELGTWGIDSQQVTWLVVQVTSPPKHTHTHTHTHTLTFTWLKGSIPCWKETQ